jgi:hypothetical protein
MIKKLTLSILAVASLGLVGCSRDADVASRNLSIAADMFEVNRRVVFYNGITGEYMLTVEGLCSLGNQDSHGQLSITCKTGATEYKKHFLGLSDNVTYFVEHLEANKTNIFFYRVIFKPTVIVPDIDVSVPGVAK